MEILNETELRDAGLDDWRQLWNLLVARYRTRDFATGLALLNRIGAAAETATHHPDVSLSYGFLEVRLVSHDAGGITGKDVELARTISGLAADAGVSADVASLTYVEVGLDAAEPDRVRPFWSAMFGSADTSGEVHDPDGRTPTIWFQVPDAPTPSGQVEQRWHFDVWVPSDQAQARIDAALAAGGRLVDDSEAPSFWVLADADGNRSCICTPQERGRG
jgi:4a-hydroxytetrahydrobiopterin dehydratase